MGDIKTVIIPSIDTGVSKILISSGKYAGITKEMIEEYIEAKGLDIKVEIITEPEMPKLSDIKIGTAVISDLSFLSKLDEDMKYLELMDDAINVSKRIAEQRDPIIHTYNSRDAYYKINTNHKNAYTKKGLGYYQRTRKK